VREYPIPTLPFPLKGREIWRRRLPSSSPFKEEVKRGMGLDGLCA